MSNKIIIAFILVILSSLCKSEDFVSIAGSDWQRFLGDVRNQDSTGMCWAFSTVTYVETMYNILTRNKYRLSPQQLADNIPKYFKEDDECYLPRPGITGGSIKCALRYIQEQGIMTEYDYPFTMGGEKDNYNSSHITPIGIRDITPICNDGTNLEKYLCLKLILKTYGVVLASIHSVATGKQQEFILNQQTNHAVLLIGIVKDSNDLEYILYQNSGGTLWGYNGFGYIRMSDENETIYNNLNVLNELYVAEVYSMHQNNEVITIHKDTIEQNYTKYFVVVITLASLCSLLLLALVVVMIVAFSRQIVIAKV
jgi:C1A family cysteine protease